MKHITCTEYPKTIFRTREAFLQGVLPMYWGRTLIDSIINSFISQKVYYLFVITALCSRLEPRPSGGWASQGPVITHLIDIVKLRNLLNECLQRNSFRSCRFLNTNIGTPPLPITKSLQSGAFFNAHFCAEQDSAIKKKCGYHLKKWVLVTWGLWDP